MLCLLIDSRRSSIKRVDKKQLENRVFNGGVEYRQTCIGIGTTGGLKHWLNFVNHFSKKICTERLFGECSGCWSDWVKVTLGIGAILSYGM